MIEKEGKWKKAGVIIQTGILIIAAFALYYSWDANNSANNISQQSLDILGKQSNYPLKVFEYPIYAIILGDYKNGSSEPVLAYGFLNTTFIIVSPNVVRLTIENMSIKKINELTSSEIPQIDIKTQDFDQTKFDQWVMNYSTNSELRLSTLPSYDNNFTYYTSHEGISSIAVSIPINGTFYLNPHHAFEIATSSNETVVVLGKVAVTAQVFNVQTNETTPVTFQTIYYAQVRIL
jgi:hypothetical protein